ncbi:hypothetical protein [Streptomyces sp. NPDC047014]|uniref:hypothetical protein n=1 Tax=Streptomyces sp. NPDC047014 TaxID=3155736 RepID=UPI0033C47BE2
MTLTVRPRRLALLAVSTAFAAGGVLVPTTAFAAPASPHTVVANGHQDRSHDDHSDKWDHDKRDKWSKGEHGKWDKDSHGKWDHDKWDHGKHDKWDHDHGNKAKHKPSEWQCFAAPCVPPSWHR